MLVINEVERFDQSSFLDEKLWIILKSFFHEKGLYYLPTKNILKIGSHFLVLFFI